VIPGHVRAHIDTRTVSTKEANRLHEKIMDRAPYIPGAEVHTELLNQRPPMERHAQTVDQAKAIAKTAGITVREDGAGGGSDGNFTAALGIPTLDGLGPEGQGLHAQHEHVLINSLPRKAALMAALLRDWPAE
jgi:glutamate carboxypeptidase